MISRFCDKEWWTKIEWIGVNNEQDASFHFDWIMERNSENVLANWFLWSKGPMIIYLDCSADSQTSWAMNSYVQIDIIIVNYLLLK
jgi:hypothetical protein